MTLYHGSYTAVEKPDLSFSRRRTDFGKGFYLTPIKTQAKKWAKRFFDKRGIAVVSKYEYNPGSSLKIREFARHNEDWLNFITDCRLGKPVDTGLDLIIGGVANDMVFDTIQLYFDKLLGVEEAIRRLQFNKPNIQYCFKKQFVMDQCLRFTGSEEMK